MEENIKVLEEQLNTYKKHLKNYEKEDCLTSVYYELKKYATALEKLVKGYRELEEKNKDLFKTCCKYEETLEHYENKIFDELDYYIKLNEISKLDKIGIKGKKYISESKIKEIYREIEKKTRNLFNSTYIPMNERIYNDNRERYEPMLKGREIAIECLKNLQELMEDK